MPPATRFIVSLLVLGLVLAVGLQRGRSATRPDDAPDRRLTDRRPGYTAFPRDVVARAPARQRPSTNVHGRIQQHLFSVNTMWLTAFKEAGEKTYEGPQSDFYEYPCGAPHGRVTGLYCRRARSFSVDTVAHERRRARLGAPLADILLAIVVAHEVGHHVQALRGAPEHDPHRELHAECLAGVWANAAELPLPPSALYHGTRRHGTKAQRLRWLNVGYRSGRPGDCDAVWSVDTSPRS